jgi:hypothetical protein
MAMAWLGPATAGQAAMAEKTSAQKASAQRKAGRRRTRSAFDSKWLTPEFYHSRSRKTHCGRLITLAALIFSYAAVLKAGN